MFQNFFSSVIIKTEKEVKHTMFMEFLYFPEDKSEYIPAFIMLVIFMAGAIATMYLFYKKSKKDEAYFNEKYQIDDIRKDSENEQQNEIHHK